MAEHIAIDELADADEGLVSSDRAAQIEAHVADCADCAEQSAALRGVSLVLATTPAPPMPPDVMTRLDEVVAAESARRTARGTPPWGALPDHGVRPSLGSFNGRGAGGGVRWLRTVLVAALAATAVGFGGYVLSATAGLNEPTASPQVYVRSSDLGEEARQLEQRSGVDAHLFSAAWRCANRLVQGRITGIASAVVDGRPAYLVYTRRSGANMVVVITGCPGPSASAGPSAPVPR